MRDRFMYWVPWGVERPWCPRIGRGCDEWHNQSIIVVIPFLGAVIFFWERGFNRFGEEHVYAWGPEGWEGAFNFGCPICWEIRLDYLDLTAQVDRWESIIDRNPEPTEG